jgi:CubicO group peptidase (beta-lactamase class C family)
LQEGAKDVACSPVFSDTTVAITCDTIITAEKLRKIDSLYQSIVKEKQFNGSFLLGRGDSVLYTDFSGYADFQTKRKLTQNSRFEIASVSKQFTAVSILILYEQGKLKLTDKVQRFIPDFPYQNITVHQLLCHRSGLPEYFKFADDYQQDKNVIIDNDSLLRMLKTFKPKILQMPNQKFDYCNTGYVVLASIVERASGMKFTDFVHTHLFKPLGMTESCFYYYETIPPKLFAVGHKKDKQHYERDYMSGIVGDKGIFTTVNDLFIWSNALDAGKVLKRETLEMAFTPKNSEMDDCKNYGYGWRIECDTCLRPLIYHGGLWNGNHTWFIKRPCDKTTLIVLSNIYNRAFLGRSKEFFAILDAE